MESRTLSRQKTYGGIQRIIHAWIGAVMVALITLGWISKAIDPGAMKISLMQTHIFLGYALAIGFVARIVWGMIGPEHARFRALLHLSSWVTAMRRLKTERSEQFGHDPFASLAYILLYCALGVGVVSGLVLAAIKYDAGPFAKFLFDDFAWHEFAMDLHETVLYVVTAFSILHITAIIFHERKKGYPIAQAMISGYQYRPICDKEMKNE